MNGKILIVGGYGMVGKTIAGRLARQFPQQVITAGRSLDKARRLCAENDNLLLPLQLDINDLAGIDSVLADVGIVVMCLDSPDTTLAEVCLDRGITYVDITSNYEIIQRIEALEPKRGIALLSVGLTPGLTNLLAKEALCRIDKPERVDISVMLGGGEKHGKAAIQWLFGQLNVELEAIENGKPVRIGSMNTSRITCFTNIGTHCVYRFPIADQIVIARTQNVPTVCTWLCMDSPLVTHLIRLVSRLTPMLPMDMLVYLANKVHIGRDICALQIEAIGNNRSITITAIGNNEGRTTGIIAAEVVKQLINRDLPPGIYHIDQLIAFESLWHILEAEGFRLLIV